MSRTASAAPWSKAGWSLIHGDSSFETSSGRVGQRPNFRRGQLELRGANQAVDLLQRRGACDRRGDALACDEPGERDFGGLRRVCLRNGVQGVEDAQASRV